MIAVACILVLLYVGIFVGRMASRSDGRYWQWAVSRFALITAFVCIAIIAITAFCRG